MVTKASNFRIESGVPVTGYPLPKISHFTTREIQVDTAAGRRAATEVTIHGENFLIRSITPEVLINGHPLVSYSITDDFQSITGYIFERFTQPVHIVVDYGLGVRGDFHGPGGVTSTPHRRLLWLLVALLILLFLAAVILGIGGPSLSWLGWTFVGGAIALAAVALMAALRFPR